MRNKLSKLAIGLLAATAISAAGISGAQAGDAEGRYAVKGIGLMPCQTFVQAAQAGQGPEVALAMSWLSGYLTAANMLLDGTYDLVSWQNEAILANALVQTCAALPDQPLAVAATQVIRTLGPDRVATAEQPERIVVGDNQTALYPSVVRKLQQALKDAGQNVTVDGDFGPGTRTAITAYQNARGIEATGFPDPVTLISLFAGQLPPQQAAAQPRPQQPLPQPQPQPQPQPLDMEPVKPALGGPGR
ncbi:peptidoglycan-binding domain-containing protein [Parvularcula lutaonensis]|uniref:Peptidoglycan-binding protein n=1 Tax=Parvularcula lutaonensis TaxID=491923 RepID=A0ABV7M862_9PROT|nr:peptidoglycan-binding domain-containing protein [Parvularcula lutaonensis]GGY43544.1 hypothetical protein GCM10007148_10410 [Parvularcula lutaonensis]